MRARVAEAPEPDHLRPDEQQVAVGKAVRSLQEHPGAVPAAQVAHHERAVLRRDLRVQRREEHVLRKADVAVQPADRGVRTGPLEALDGVARIVQQHEHDGARGAPRRRPRGEGRPRRHRLDERYSARGTELRPRAYGRSAAPATGARAGSGEPAAAMGTEGQQAAGAASTKGAGEPFGPGRCDYGWSHDARPGNPRPGGGRLEARGLAHGFAAIHAELRPGVVVTAAVGAGGHGRRYSTSAKLRSANPFGK